MDAEFWQQLLQWLNAGQACVLATVVKAEGSVPRQPGAKMIIRADGLTAGTVGGGALEHAVVRAALELCPAGEARLLSYQLKPDLGMACGGSADVFLEPLAPPEELFIFGGGHIAQSLSPLAAALGFRVTIIDERPDFTAASRFPQAAAFVRSYDPASWEELSFGARTYCVVVTPDHRHDTEVVIALLTRQTRYVGMIGSRRKRASVERALLGAGIPQQRIDALHSPVGVAIGAETPAEIAVSIAAELVSARRGPSSPPAGENRVDKTRFIQDDQVK